MIKFWKSAAKGKSGFPVRPPEQESATESKSITLDTIQENEDISHLFEKHSRLSLQLSEVLSNRITLKYFLEFMDSIAKLVLIKCWLEIHDFKQAVMKASTSCSNERNQLLSRTKSFDLDWKSQKNEDDLLSGNSIIKISSNHQVNKWRMSRGDCSSSSCQNLNEQDIAYRELDKRKQYDVNNLTDDAVKLFKTYVALEAPHSIDMPDNIRKSVISNICNPQGNIKEDCFEPLQDFLFNTMETKYYADFQQSPLHIKAQIDILTSGSLNLKDILYNETILFYFTEYLEQESRSLLLEFLMAIMHYRDNLVAGPSDPQLAQDDAIIIYDKYFSLQATSPIGFSTDIRLQVESKICNEGGPLYSCFDVPYQIVFKTLSHYVKTFLESEVYYKYLTEMINSVDQTWPSHRRSQSDCSSEFSISTQNTLLASGDPVFHKKARNHSVPDMTIDSNQLYNADALWQRKKQDGLSLGRINSLGRFESKFEPNPDKKERSVLKKMVSRLVPINSNRVEEEMAWQIAHMIVKDVTDLTMAAPPENDRDNSN